MKDLDLDDVAATSKLAKNQLDALRADSGRMAEMCAAFVALYNDDRGMDAFPAVTQVEGKSTTLFILRKARAALKAHEEIERG